MDFDELTQKEKIIEDSDKPQKTEVVESKIIPEGYYDRPERKMFLEDMKQKHIQFHSGARGKLNAKIGLKCKCYYCERKIHVEIPPKPEKPKKVKKVKKKEEKRKDTPLTTNGYSELKGPEERKEKKPFFDFKKLMFWKKKESVLYEGVDGGDKNVEENSVR